ncbi:nucleoside-diphosphate kinase [Celerinatantimonas sp. MCCC 1A17872]|uniref:nucleoside-diphosphate kinase n=1 Tax=Celerinatantimonas sp. MCCC 1A17872 TaxID=3177514 RepID=UPI0038C7F8E3
MVRERTFSIIKPDAVKQAHIGAIYHQIESAGLRIVAAKMLHLSQEQAEGFYGEHEGKPFYNALIEFMTQGPIMVQVLEGENAIETYRALMGDTDPLTAAKSSLRGQFGSKNPRNAVHGSDAPESAAREIAFFFSDEEIVG